MRFAIRDLTPLCIRIPDDSIPNDGRYHWQAGGNGIVGVIKPDRWQYGTREQSAASGERTERRCVLYYAGDALIAERMGVCIGVRQDMSCDWRVIRVENWQEHIQATLEWIPENMRG